MVSRCSKRGVVRKTQKANIPMIYLFQFYINEKVEKTKIVAYSQKFDYEY